MADTPMKILENMQGDWEQSAEYALADAERFHEVTMKLVSIYSKSANELTLGDIVELKDMLEIFDHSLTETFGYVFYNSFVANWIDEVRLP